MTQVVESKHARGFLRWIFAGLIFFAAPFCLRAQIPLSEAQVAQAAFSSTYSAEPGQPYQSAQFRSWGLVVATAIAHAESGFTQDVVGSNCWLLNSDGSYKLDAYGKHVVSSYKTYYPNLPPVGNVVTLTDGSRGEIQNHDRGLWQINDYYHKNDVSNNQAFDSAGCASAAYGISKKGTDWSQWSTFGGPDQYGNGAGNGKYRSYMQSARSTASQITGSGVITGTAGQAVQCTANNTLVYPVAGSSNTTGIPINNGATGTIVGSNNTKFLQLNHSGRFYDWWQVNWGNQTGWVAEDFLQASGSSSAVTLKTITKANGVFVFGATVKINGITAGSTDAVGQLILSGFQCGNYSVEATHGGLHYIGFLNFQCPQSNRLTDKSNAITQADTLSSGDNSYTLEMDSDASCGSFSSLNNFAIGDKVEVYGTGDGLRARYPDPCSDSYAVMPDLSAGTIVGSWQCCNGYIRWKIHYDNLQGIDVWSAEGEPSTGQTFLRKKQNSTCTYSLAPSRLDLDTNGAAGSAFNVNTSFSCYWNAVANQNWISITTNASGSGSKQVTFSVSVNTGASSRTGTITVADQIFTVTQPGTASPTPTPTPGALSLGSNDVFVPASSTDGSVYVYNKPSGSLNWSATTTTPWITIGTPTGTATVNGSLLRFTCPQNTATSQRVGTITISSPGASGSPQTLTVSQGGTGNAAINITDIFIASTVRAGDYVTVSWNQNCPITQPSVRPQVKLYPTAQTALSYDTINNAVIYVPAGSSNAGTSFGFPADMYSGTYDVEVLLWEDTNHDGSIDAGDTLLGIFKKTGAIYITGAAPPTPILSVTSNNVDVGSLSGGANLLVSNSGHGTLNWSAMTSDTWLSLELSSGSAESGVSNPLSFTFQPNISPLWRSGTITVADSSANDSPQSVTVSQQGKLQVWSLQRSNDNNTFALSWTADPAHTYSIIRSADPGFTAFDIIANALPGNSPTFTDTTLPPGTTAMFYDVRLDDGVNGTPTPTPTPTVTPTPTATPSPTATPTPSATATPTATPTPQGFVEAFNNAPDYTNNWHIISNTGAIQIAYRPGNFQLFASRSGSGSNLSLVTNVTFTGDIDISFQFNHQGYGRTNVGLVTATDGSGIALAALDTDDTNYLNFIVQSASTEYQHAGTPYMNRPATIRIQMIGTQVNFYAGVDGNPPALLNTLTLGSAPPEYRLMITTGSVPWKSGDNTTSFTRVNTN